MLFFLQCWGLRSEGREDPIASDADDLILLYGAHAYEEARRRRSEAGDVTEARRWSAVKSEIGRRILAVCSGAVTNDALRSKLIGGGDASGAIWDPPPRADVRRPATKSPPNETQQVRRTPSPTRASSGAEPVRRGRRGIVRLLSWRAGAVPA